MTIVTDTWRQLVQRRLWPVALLLLGALVAVPFLLAKSPEPTVAPAAVPATATTASAASSDPIVEAVSDEEGAPARRVLGVRHNPFKASARIKKAKVRKQSTTTTASNESPQDQSSSDASNGGSAPSTGTAPTAPAQPTETVPAGSIAVRFGTGDAELPLLRFGRLEALPSQDEPLLVYMGLKDGGKTAIFMVDDSMTPSGGDGHCPQESCETIELKAGETEFFEVKTDEGTTEYQLDVARIYQHAAKVPATDSGSGSGSGSSGAGTAG